VAELEFELVPGVHVVDGIQPYNPRQSVPTVLFRAEAGKAYFLSFAPGLRGAGDIFVVVVDEVDAVSPHRFLRHVSSPTSRETAVAPPLSRSSLGGAIDAGRARARSSRVEASRETFEAPPCPAVSWRPLVLGDVQATPRHPFGKGADAANAADAADAPRSTPPGKLDREFRVGDGEIVVRGDLQKGGELRAAIFVAPAGNRWQELDTRDYPRVAPSSYDVELVVGKWLLFWPTLKCSQYFVDFSSGWRVDTVARRASSISRVGAPSPRSAGAVVAVANNALVWGGQTGQPICESQPKLVPLGDGAAYDPASNRWTPIARSGAPTPRSNFITYGLIDGFLVLGGHLDPEEAGLYGDDAAFDGAMYQLSSRRWTPIDMQGGPRIPSLYRGHGTAISWTGRRLLIAHQQGWQFDPVSNRWGAWRAPPIFRQEVVLADGRVFWPARDGKAFLLSPERNLACRLSLDGIPFFQPRPGYEIDYATPRPVNDELVFTERLEREILVCSGGPDCGKRMPENIQNHDGGVLTLPKWPPDPAKDAVAPAP
jgi:hypothetical protein